MPLAGGAGNSVFQGGCAVASEITARYSAAAFYLNAFKASFAISLVTAADRSNPRTADLVVLQRMPGRIQQFVLICSNIGANFTGFPLAFAFVILMGVSGSFTLLLVRAGIVKDFNIYSSSGLVIVYSYFQVLLGILLILPGLGAITREVREAAHLMGAGGLVFWRRIGLPILAPSLVSAFIMLFANAMGTYATAWALVGGSANLVTIRIGELTAGDVFSDPNLADALAMLLVICLTVLIMIEQFVVKPRRPCLIDRRDWSWIGLVIFLAAPADCRRGAEQHRH